MKASVVKHCHHHILRRKRRKENLLVVVVVVGQVVGGSRCGFRSRASATAVRSITGRKGSNPPPSSNRQHFATTDSIDMRSIFSVLNRTAITAWQPPTRTLRSPRAALKLDSICARCRQHQIRFSSSNRQLADDPRWLSVVDHPAQVVRAGRKHGPGLIILGIAPMYNSSSKDVSLK